MPEDFDNPLALVTTDMLISELARRHQGDERALCLVSCTPGDGLPGMGELRTVFMCRDKRLLLGIVNKAFSMLKEEEGNQE